MKSKIVRSMLLVALLCGLFAPLTGVQAAASAVAPKPALVSPDGFLNADGTLKMDGSLNGSLNLSGYNVRMDPLRGPVFGATAYPQTAPVAGQWAGLGSGLQTLNGNVMALAVSGTDVYIGGIFTDANGIPAADMIVEWNGSVWSALGSNGAGNGSLGNAVDAIAVSGSNVYVGGDFTDVNNNGSILSAADYIAKWDGANWSALRSNGAGDGSLNYRVKALAVSGSSVYVGGNFTDVNNNGMVLAAADSIAKWNGSDWSALGSNGAGDGAIPSVVSAIAIMGTDVYVGGSFSSVNNKGTVLNTASYIAKWDGTNWSALGSNGAGGGALNGAVNVLTATGTNLYVGGGFTDVHNGILALPSADYIARWDGSSWYSLGTGAGNGALTGYVCAIVVSGTTIYTGGNFTNIHNGSTLLADADYIAKFDGVNWSALGGNGAGNGSLSSTVEAIAINGSNVYSGGDFTNTNNNGAVLSGANHFAVWNGMNWSAPAGINPNGALANGVLPFTLPFVYAVAVSGSNVYVGGDFVDVQDGAAVLPSADFVARWDGTNWNALGSNGAGNGSLNGTVRALALSGTDLYVGGDFTNVNNAGTDLGAADYIAKWDGANWSALGDNGSGDGSLNSAVRALAVSGTDLYVGGQFTDVNDGGSIWTSADYITRWDGTHWSPLSGNGVSDGSLNAVVNALVVNGPDLYVGGNFTNVNNAGTALPSADYLAKWDGNNWSALGNNGAGDGSLNYYVEALAYSGTNLYVGGSFTDVNNNGTVLNAADYIARWDGANWSALGHNASGNGVFTGTIASIVTNGPIVYVGGYFSNPNNANIMLTAADYIARWDGSNWSALSDNGAGNGSLISPVVALAVSGSTLYVGGSFLDVNSGGTLLPAADYIAAYGLPPVTISGNAGTAGATLSYTGGGLATSAADGSYTIALPSGWSGTVTPSKTGYTFAPVSRVYASVATDTTGENYAATAINYTATLTSIGAQDGWILESSELSNKGGSMKAGGATIFLGDNAARKQYRAILSFSTGPALPDNAMITSITLKLKKQSNVGGGNPIKIFKGFMADIKNGLFNLAALETKDFQAAASGSYGPFKPALVGGWYSLDLTAGSANINELSTASGLTQIRLRFKLDDNNNAIANYLSFYSGNAPLASRPQLIIVYHLP